MQPPTKVLCRSATTTAPASWSLAATRPLSRTASSAAATANWVKRAILRASRLSMRAAGVKVLDLRGQLYFKISRIKSRDRSYCAAASLNVRPAFCHRIAGRIYRAKAGNNDPAFLFCVHCTPHIPIPPSTQRTCPVIYPACSPARKATAAATSSAWPILPAGMAASAAARAGSDFPQCILCRVHQ